MRANQLRQARRAALAAGVALAGLGGWSAVAPAASQTAPASVTIKTAGRQSFKANRSFTETMHFAPGAVTIRSGGMLTLAHGPADKASEPHTLTIVNRGELPKTAAQVAGCGNGHGSGPPDACSLAEGNHPGPGHPHGNLFVDVGKPGLDERGDSIGIPPTGPHGAPPAAARFTVKVTAAPGTDLYFLCAVHPWMQGEIHVK